MHTSLVSPLLGTLCYCGNTDNRGQGALTSFLLISRLQGMLIAATLLAGRGESYLMVTHFQLIFLHTKD